MSVDTRKRETVFPVRIVKTFGNVKNAEALLKAQPLQITTNEPDCATLTKEVSEQTGVLVDFGREIHGSARVLCFINFDTKTGAALAEHPTVRVSCGESASEALGAVGVKGSTNDHAVRDYSFPMPSYCDMTLFETGFRFVFFELLTPGVTMLLRSVAAVSVMRDIPYIGSFRSSNDILNKIFDVSAYTCHLCMQDYIWDGIKRDRLVWVGDMHPEMLTVRTVFGQNEVLENSLRFTRDSTPLPGWMNGFPTYSLWWLKILHDWYFYTGDLEFLDEFREYALGLITQVCDHVNDDGTDTLPAYFLDWPCHELPEEISGSRAVLAWALEAGENLCRVFGDEAAAQRCNKKRSALLSCKAETYGAKQVAAILSLAGWMDEKAAAKEILNGGARGFSTFMSYYLLSAAARGDMSATLAALCEYYGGMLSMGATTFWEDFSLEWMKNAAPIDELVPEGKSDIHGDNGAFCYKGFRHSFCHGWSSGPTAFLCENVLGIKILEAGCKKIAIRPDLGDLLWAEGTFPTPMGVLSVSHKRLPDGSIKTAYSAPDGVEIVE